jgi:hypothetical protein
VKCLEILFEEMDGTWKGKMNKAKIFGNLIGLKYHNFYG